MDTFNAKCQRLIRPWVICLWAAFSGASAFAWLGPSEQDPYLLGNPAAPVTDWRWEDARGASLQATNLATRDGYRLGDTVFKPRPFEYLQAEFARQVQAHPAQAALKKRLHHQTLRLIESDVAVGLWMRFTEHQQGNWDMVRVRLVIEFDGDRYEAIDTHPFRSREKPSPVSAPMQAVVQSLVSQLQLFASEATETTTAPGEAEPAPPTDEDVLKALPAPAH